MKIDFEAIRQSNPIADVVARYVPSLKKHGKEYKGLCPFHNEKTPSFTVVPHKGFYHCHGCGAHGDVIDFAEKSQGCTTAQAIEFLTGGNPLHLDSAKETERQAAIAARDAQQAKEQQTAIAKARARWDAAKPADMNHGYLDRKLASPHTIRQDTEGNLILPIYGADGELQSVQAIDEHGGKKFHPGAPVKHGRMMIGINMGRTIIVEGYATGDSVYEAQPDQVVIAYSKANIHNVARQLAGEGRSIVIAADNNAAIEMEALADELQCPLILPPAPYDDFNDYRVAQGIDAVASTFAAGLKAFADKRLVKERAAEEERIAATGPVDLWASPQAPELRRGFLPKIIEDFAFENAKLIGADPAGLAMAALAACGAALPDRVRAKPKVHENWTQPARLWVLLIGDASTNKSACVSRATDRIESLDVGMFRHGNTELAKWQKDKKDGLENPKPPRPRLMLGDATIEATQEALKDSPDGILLRQDEMSSLFAKCGQAGNQAERSFWLQTFNGGSYAVSRIGRGEYIIDNLSVSMLGGIQPTAMHTVVNSGDDDGLIQRFTPILLREGGEEMDVPIPPVNDDFAGLIDTLRNFPCADNFVEPDAPYEFSEAARDVRVALLRDLRILADNIKCVNVRLSSHVGKYRGMFVRLAMLLHAIENAPRIREGQKPEQAISGLTAKRARDFMMDYLFPHALTFYRTTGAMTEDDEIVQAIGGWILANDIERFTMRDLVRNVRQFKALKDDLKKERIIGMMEAYGWADPNPKKMVNRVWIVPSEARDMYVDKAKSERSRRQAVKAMIAGTVAEIRTKREQEA